MSAIKLSHRRHQRGASLVEMAVVMPIFLFIVLGLMQAAMVFHAKSNVNYAAFEAARAGSVGQAKVASITAAFQKALIPYYGGGRTEEELAATLAKVTQDVTTTAMRVEILSPTQESFTDYNSPALQTQYDTSEQVVPSVGLDQLGCPRDATGCQSNPASNASGQTLLDANLLKLRIVYGIPPAKQMPLAGPFYVWALKQLGSASSAGSSHPATTDDSVASEGQSGSGNGSESGSGTSTDTTEGFKKALLAAGRIPVVTSTIIRMQSDAIKNTAMVSSPGPGNNGSPTGSGPTATSPSLPTCGFWDPTCSACTSSSDGTCSSIVPGNGGSGGSGDGGGGGGTGGGGGGGGGGGSTPGNPPTCPT